MKQVDEMPTSGQFVAVFNSDSGIFSTTYRFFDGSLYYYGFTSDENEGTNEWYAVNEAEERKLFTENSKDVMFFVQDETIQ